MNTILIYNGIYLKDKCSNIMSIESTVSPSVQLRSFLRPGGSRTQTYTDQWGENGHDRKLQRYKTQRLVTHLHRDMAHDPECHTSSERLSHPAVSERPCSPKSVVSHLPLRVRVYRQLISREGIMHPDILRGHQ